MPAAVESTPQLRTRLRAEVGLAADVLVPNWPLSSFIAVNPLGGLEEHGFERAVRIAEAMLGARGHLPEERFRALAAEGRIAASDLRRALERRHPAALAHPPVPAGGREAGPAEVLLADLLHAPAAPGPAPEPTAAERVDVLLGTSIAAAVDDEVDGWCAAFLDEGQAAWAMPDRRLGLYGAWRAIGAHDRGLRRLGAGDLRAAIAALPEDPADALAHGLRVLGVEADARAAELRRHLGRRPGWASAIRWRAEHRPGEREAPADLVDLLAVRVSLEALLVRAAARAGGSPALPPSGATTPGAPAAGAAEQRVAAVAEALGASPEAHAAIATILADVPPAARPAVWQSAYEEHYRVPLLRALDRPAPRPSGRRPLAQAVFCIDARSEGLRRHLEREGDYETLGFAGFFAVAMRFRRLGSDGADDSCPVLLTPRNDVTERPEDEDGAARFLDAGRGDAARRRTAHRVREDVATPFAMAEASGWVLGPAAAVRTLAPAAYDRGRAALTEPRAPATRVVIDRLDARDAEDLVGADERRIVAAALAARLGRRGRRAGPGDLERLRRRALGTEEPGGPLDGLRLSGAGEAALLRELRDEHGLTARGHHARLQEAAALGFSREEQIAVARTALVMMGLTSGFGRLVLLCGHGSRTENNPYESALDCGACGGNQGGPNARVAAAILNRPHVRDALRVAGIEVPEDTFFVAGQHDTAADTVTVFDRGLVPEGHRADLERLEADLGAAGAANSRERLRRLPGAPDPGDATTAHRHARTRGRDWAQIRPEWGLARNAAFIVGGRDVTRGLDLECRTFLHSYDAAVDADGAMLETILTAPLVVAQWINCQYYFSTVDPERFGAGNKTLHNVVAGLGVLRGPGGDLRLGLPAQGALDGERLYHEPMRLLAIVEAPPARIDGIVARNPVLQHLFGGEWVAIAAREQPGDPWLRRETDGTWVPYLEDGDRRPAASPAGRTGGPAAPSMMAVTA
jgi:hypothetical protein